MKHEHTGPRFVARNAPGFEFDAFNNGNKTGFVREPEFGRSLLIEWPRQIDPRQEEPRLFEKRELFRPCRSISADREGRHGAGVQISQHIGRQEQRGCQPTTNQPAASENTAGDG
jgi:hypothetical protein